MCKESPNGSLAGELLHDSEAGSLDFCPDCSAFGLTFGSLHVRLGARAVLELERVLDSMSRRPPDEGRRYRIHFKDTPATLALSAEDLAHLGTVVRDGCRLARDLPGARTPRTDPRPDWVN